MGAVELRLTRRVATVAVDEGAGETTAAVVKENALDAQRIRQREDGSTH